jgi:hypothetical protein
MGTRNNGHILRVPHVAFHKLPQKHTTRRLSGGQTLTVRNLSNSDGHFKRNVTQLAKSREQDALIQLLFAHKFSDSASGSLMSE